MSDLIERLLAPDWHDPACPFLERCHCDYNAPHDAVRHPLARESADEITALRERVAELRERLIQADLKIRSFPGADQSDVEFIRAILAK